jgi:acetylornithine deacetylase/succinyl-diaminopimelate desuccinylase-like protein
MVARIEGSDPTAPSLCLMGHTDVVPVNAAGWTHDPFAGEVIDGEVWGRGAIDMLNLTSTMAVAFRRLATEGFRPTGDLIYFGVADEEAGGTWGAEWMAEHHWATSGDDAVGARLPLRGRDRDSARRMA